MGVQTPHTDRMAAEKSLNMKKRGLSKVALLSETSGFGQSGKKETEAVAGKYGVSLVANETYGPKDTDMSPQLTRSRTPRRAGAVHLAWARARHRHQELQATGADPALVPRPRRGLGRSSSSWPARRPKAMRLPATLCW